MLNTLTLLNGTFILHFYYRTILGANGKGKEKYWRKETLHLSMCYYNHFIERTKRHRFIREICRIIKICIVHIIDRFIHFKVIILIHRVKNFFLYKPGSW